MKQKKFKLVKCYPGSPRIGSIAKLQEGYNYYTYPEISTREIVVQELSHIENNPEFWEEIKEKEYEILSLIGQNNKIVRNITNQCCIESLVNQGLKIHSIKRLSDGEVFFVGDKIVRNDLNKEKIRIIEKFWTGHNTLHIKCTDSKNLPLLSKIEHYKEPLFTTEDGVDVYEGDEFWYLQTTGKEVGDEEYFVAGQAWIANKTTVKTPCEGKYFSTKEKAEEYRNNLLLEEAKKRYPVGTKFVNAMEDVRNNPDYNIGKVDSIIAANELGIYTGKWYLYVFDNKEWAEIVKEKTLEDYENILLKDYKNVKSSGIYISRGQYFKWLKEIEPKLYWTKVLQLIADDLNEGWKPDWNNYTFKVKIHYSISLKEYKPYYIISQDGGIIFKDKEIIEKAIKILGNKLDCIFKN